MVANGATAYEREGGRVLKAEELKHGVHCTGAVDCQNGKRRVMFHSPFEEVMGEDGGHLEQYLGKCLRVFHAPILGCHLYIFPPSEPQPYYVIVTMGLSGFTMPSEDPELQRCELACLLPGEVTLPSCAGVGANIDADNCMAELLLWLAPWIVDTNALFKHNDGIGGNPFEGTEPFYNSTRMACAMLRRDDERLPSFRGVDPYTRMEHTINFLWVVPLTLREYEFRRLRGSGALHDLLVQHMAPEPPILCRLGREEVPLPGSKRGGGA